MVLKKLLVILLILFACLQFIRPERNINSSSTGMEITRVVHVPEKVMATLKNSCYDCHSNNTHYPWYVNIQPLGWKMAQHIRDGKANLNFDAFGSYSSRKKVNKLRAVKSSIAEGYMPLTDYLFLHRSAKLDEAEKKLISEWTDLAMQNIQASNEAID